MYEVHGQHSVYVSPFNVNGCAPYICRQVFTVRMYIQRTGGNDFTHVDFHVLHLVHIPAEDQLPSIPPLRCLFNGANVRR